MKPRQKRIAFIASGILCLGVAVALVLNAFQSNLVFFHSPTDILEGKPEGLALDMNQSRSIEGFETKIVGQTTTVEGAGYEAISGSDVVVITAGLPRRPGMSRIPAHPKPRRRACRAFSCSSSPS